MGMNGVRQMSDTRRLSPQTTSSSGYHSDLSLTTESPRSIPPIVEQSSYLQNEKTNLSVNKKILRISCFIRKQYERVKLKLTPQKQISQHIITCSKATSTTPVPYKSENHYLQPQELPSCRYKQSSFIEPVKYFSSRICNHSFFLRRFIRFMFIQYTIIKSKFLIKLFHQFVNAILINQHNV
jgi:hypothetical protein